MEIRITDDGSEKDINEYCLHKSIVVFLVVIWLFMGCYTDNSFFLLYRR